MRSKEKSKSSKGKGKGTRKTSGTRRERNKEFDCFNCDGKATLQEVAKAEVSEEPSMTAIGLRTSTIIGAADNHTEAKETENEIESMSSTTKSGNKRKPNGKSRKKAAHARWDVTTWIVVEESMETWPKHVGQVDEQI